MTAAAECFEQGPSGRAILRVMTISHAVDLWLGELERKTHSDRTLDTYRRLLHKLADAHPQIDVDELTPQIVRGFLDKQGRKENGARKAPTTIAQNVSIVNGFLDWLTFEGLVDRNPARRNGQRILSRPRLAGADENDNVVTVSGREVGKLLAAADKLGRWPERLAVNALAYLGPRRHALAVARIEDYDPVERVLAFREKGGKTIAKPVPHRLADLIAVAILDGVYDDQDYLIPGRASQRRAGDRDDRIIWHLVREVGAEAGVTTHVHALRAAFAVHYLETHPGQIEALQKLMGHKRIETTLVYLRRLNRRQAMETVRDLDWGNSGEGEIRTREPGFPSHPLSRRAPSATRAPHQGIHAVSGNRFESKPTDALLDLEPSILVESLLERLSRQHEPVAPVERRRE